MDESIQLPDEFFGSFHRASLCYMASRIGDFSSDLFPEEEAYIERAVEKRKQEFIAGRVLARKCLKELGFNSCPIIPDERRCPQWPEGIAGSITHTRKHCIAVVGRAESIGSIGVDLEKLDRLESKLWRLILTDTEQRWIANLAEAKRNRFATLVFSAKEAFFKYQYPLTKAWVGFLDAEVVVKEDQCAFLLTLRNAIKATALEKGFQVQGRYCFLQDSVFSAVLGKDIVEAAGTG